MSADFLNQAVDSLLNQTYKNIEVLLINDGSPDSSGDICNDYAQKDNRVTVVHQKNQGAATALNVGIEIAKGQYFMFLDGDDWLNINAIEEAMNMSQKHNVDIVFWPFIKEYENSSLQEISTFTQDELFEGDRINWLKRRMVGLVGDELKQPTRTDAFNSGWGKLYKAQLIRKKVQWTDTNIVGSSDVIFNIQVSKYIKSAFYMHKFYTHYRKYNPHSLTRNYKFTLLPKYINLFDHIECHISSNNLSKEYLLALNNRISVSAINHLLSITTPENKLSYTQTKAYIKEVLTHPKYKEALNKFDTTPMALHWKMFFLACKYRHTDIVLLLGKIMRKLR